MANFGISDILSAKVKPSGSGTGEILSLPAGAASDKGQMYQYYKKRIEKAYYRMEHSYLETAVALHAIYNKELYRLDGYKNIYEFAEENYNISRGTCHNFLSICGKFGKLDSQGLVVGLLDCYGTYSVSQLAVMQTFPQELLNQCNDGMSVRELKRMKQAYEKGLTASQQELELAGSGQGENGQEKEELEQEEGIYSEQESRKTDSTGKHCEAEVSGMSEELGEGNEEVRSCNYQLRKETELMEMCEAVRVWLEAGRGEEGETAVYVTMTMIKNGKREG